MPRRQHQDQCPHLTSRRKTNFLFITSMSMIGDDSVNSLLTTFTVARQHTHHSTIYFLHRSTNIHTGLSASPPLSPCMTIMAGASHEQTLLNIHPQSGINYVEFSHTIQWCAVACVEMHPCVPVNLDPLLTLVLPPSECVA